MSKWTKEAIDRIKELYEDHSYKEIAKMIKEEFGLKKSANAVRKAYERFKIEPKDFSPKPKILLVDIETLPIEAYIWSIWQRHIPLSMVKKDWSVLSWAAKWHGEDEIMYQDVRGQRDLRDDKRILKKLWKLLDQADIVVAHNGDKFDIKKINTRFMLNGMQPPSRYRTQDTLKIAKRVFGFTSNKLSELTKKLCVKYKKLDHGEMPGFKMWEKCLERDKRAFELMEEYNKYDVLSLEELYDKMLPWDNSINFNIYNEGEEPVCSCGSEDFKKSGYYYTNASKFQKYRCKKCGAEYRDKKNLAGSNLRSVRG